MTRFVPCSENYEDYFGMKNNSFFDRFSFAGRGIQVGWQAERSFRIQIVLATVALGFLAILRPDAVWWAVFVLIIGAVLAAELFNTALEFLIDRVHPDLHPMIGNAKDCAAGAVLLLSLAAVGILGALLMKTYA